VSRPPRIELAHGAGGLATGRLVRELFLSRFGGATLARLDDGAVIGSIAISTDSFVVDPWCFPGGDIGKLAVCGTVNDVAMCGAAARALSVGFILEEGFGLDDLGRVADSMAAEARRAGVEIVTGDTKVVPRGKGGGVYVNTTGFGDVLPGVRVSGQLACPGDRVLVSGPVGDHGAAIMACRAGIELGGSLRSDCAVVAGAVVALLLAVPEVHVLRDPTRGGLAAALNEIAGSSGVGIEIRERDVPVSADTRAACDLLGFDPLAMACEGRFLAFVPAARAAEARAVLESRSECPAVREIGEVVAAHPRRVVLHTEIGGRRILDVAEGELLPRIC
jgi:hydrogenase expression/formation protein HypE